MNIYIILSIVLFVVCLALAKFYFDSSRLRAEAQRNADEAKRDADEARRIADEAQRNAEMARNELQELRVETASLRDKNSELQAGIAASREDALRKESQFHRDSAALMAEVAALKSNLNAAEERVKAKDEQIAQQSRLSEELLRQQEERFRNLASEIMEKNSQKFHDDSSRKINDMLMPLKENIENFRKAVGDAYEKESRERFSLQHEIQALLELNKTIGKEARDLTRALRSDTKLQGDWGEMILEQLLEKSGLQKGIHFDTQVTRDTDNTRLTDGEGHSLRADMVVYYPDDRCIVIDSKVSLTAFVDYINLADDPDDGDGERRKKAAAMHLASVKSHINELARKNYQDLIGKKRMDFVMMFIPNEAAYIAAMQIEPSLWQEAYDKRVLLVSPTQLISVLRMLTQLWRQDAVNRNVEEIGRLSGALLDKFTGMMDAFDDVEQHIRSTQDAFSTLRNRLSEGKGNVFVTAKKILDLGAKAKKKLPEK